MVNTRVKTMIVKKRKGISTFIATLLLMVLAVAAGVVIYAYVMGYLGGFTTPQTMGAISLDTSSLTIGTGVSAYIRNIGHTSFTASAVYVDGVAIKQAATGTPPVIGWSFSGTVDEGKVGQLTIPDGTAPNGYTFAAGVTYQIKIVGVDNTQLSFQIKG